jgi:glycosyltransferase involved in cell wall biosynthesis
VRVAIVSRSIYPLHGHGGLERHTFDLVRALLTANVAVRLIVPPAKKHSPADAAANEVYGHPSLTISYVPYPTFPLANRRWTTILDRSTSYLAFGLRAGRRAAQFSSRGEIDVVHGMGASVLGYALGRDGTQKAPLVLNPHGMEEFGATVWAKRLGYWPLRAAVRRCARAAQCVIATDRALVEPVRSRLKVAPEKVRIIPNAVTLAQVDDGEAAALAETLRHSIGLSSGGTLFLSVGRLEANKGFDVLVRALKSLQDRHRLPDEWRWVLVGGGPQLGRIQRQGLHAGISDHVVMRGQIGAEELHGWYEAASVFIHPTLYEGSSIVTLEAMSHRRAVIASRAGGLPDKVVPGVTGWLVPPGDDGALADAISDAIGDPVRLAAMGTAGRALVEREFSWPAIAEQLLGVYRELLSRPASM